MFGYFKIIGQKSCLSCFHYNQQSTNMMAIRDSLHSFIDYNGSFHKSAAYLPCIGIDSFSDYNGNDLCSTLYEKTSLPIIIVVHVCLFLLS